MAGSRKAEPAAKAALPGALCRGKALWAGKTVFFDERAVEADLVPQSCRTPAAWGATGSVRGHPPTLGLAENAGSRWHHHAWCPTHCGSRLVIRSCVVVTEAGGAPSSAYPTGVELPKGGSTPFGRTRSRSGKHPTVVRSASCGLGDRVMYGCSCRKSVAEVGKKHLFRVPRGAARRTKVAREQPWPGASG